jgi:hypothetical protein
MNSASQEGRLPQWKRTGIGDPVHSSLHPRRTGFRTVMHKETTMLDSIGEIAHRHGFSAAAAHAVADALRHGGGRMAQFNHPELGGMGQWSVGGMLMIGDMFNHALKARVDALCLDLAAMPAPAQSDVEQRPEQAKHWWPDGLGTPSATGAQNDMRYACFPDHRRLAVAQGGQVRVYDTGDHRIGGFSQQQSGRQSLSFNSQLGTIRLEDLQEV